MSEAENPKNYNYVAVVDADGNVVKLSAVHKDADQTCLNKEPFKQIDGKITDPTDAASHIYNEITKKSGGGSTRKTHNGGRKHKGKKSRGKGRKSRSKSKSRSKARR